MPFLTIFKLWLETMCGIREFPRTGGDDVRYPRISQEGNHRAIHELIFNQIMSLNTVFKFSFLNGMKFCYFGSNFSIL